MQYEKFEEWMIGRRVREISSGDIGVITRMKEVYYENEQRIYILWENGHEAGEERFLRMWEIEFVNELSESVEQTTDEMVLEMNGKRYRLVEIKEKE